VEKNDGNVGWSPRGNPELAKLRRNRKVEKVINLERGAKLERVLLFFR